MSDELKQQRKDEGAIISADKRMPASGQSPASAYLARHGVGALGTFIKFGKNGAYQKQLDDAEIPKGTKCVVVYDQTRLGWIKFQGKGLQPIRKMGLVFDGFNPVERNELDDQDQSLWEVGISGEPTDPWQFQILLPLQDTESGELLIFGTTSKTGRGACDNVISMCERMQRSEPDYYPIIRLDVGSYLHKNPRIGKVLKPQFTRIGRALKADVSVSSTDASDDFNDAVPY